MAMGGVIFMLCLMLAIVSATIAADDAYIAGYAASVLHNEFKAAKASLLVQNGVVTVDASRSAPWTEPRSKQPLKIFPV